MHGVRGLGGRLGYGGGSKPSLKHVLMRQSPPATLRPPKQSPVNWLVSRSSPMSAGDTLRTGFNAHRFYSKMYGSSEFDDTSVMEGSTRRPSTVDDVNVMTVILNEVIALKTIAARSWLGDGKIKSLCSMYKQLEKAHRNHFITTLACDYGIDPSKVDDASRNILDTTGHNPLSVMRHQDNLRNALSPQYSWLFKRLGRLENGVKFLVDFRADIIDCLKETPSDSPTLGAIQQLNTTLRDLLAMWFSVGFLKLERVTWRSSCEMLQKISEYEAVHPVRSWADIKRRVGPYRRCFVFVHSSMETEPLVVLHTALCETIPASLAAIVNSRPRMNSDAPTKFVDVEDMENIRAGIFYSITSTQRGLQGVDLGNYLIKRVVRELQAEFPSMVQFATLSPIPNFRAWLMDKIKAAERGKLEILTVEEIELLREGMNGNDFWLDLRRILKSNSWVESPTLSAVLRIPLLRLAARYLYQEKRRNLALCSVANFHLSNGAVLWRINWRADLSARGLNNSCGLMVNYRYFLEDTEQNSEQYLGHHEVIASEEVRNLSQAAESVAVMSKL